MNIGLLGGTGVMAHMIINRLLLSGIENASLFFSGRTKDNIAKTTTKFGITALSNPELLKTCDLIFLCVRPGDFQRFAPLKVEQGSKKIVISIMAAVTIEQLQTTFPQTKIIRAMPTLGGKVGKSMTVWFTNDRLGQQEESIITKYLSSLGKALKAKKEENVDFFTPLIGSGPAYLYYLMQSLEEKGEEFGFSAKESRDMVRQMIQGALEFMIQSNRNSSDLIEEVTTKGGITETAVKYLKENKVKKLLKEAVEKGHEKVEEVKRDIAG